MKYLILSIFITVSIPLRSQMLFSGGGGYSSIEGNSGRVLALGSSYYLTDKIHLGVKYSNFSSERQINPISDFGTNSSITVSDGFLNNTEDLFHRNTQNTQQVIGLALNYDLFKSNFGLLTVGSGLGYFWHKELDFIINAIDPNASLVSYFPTYLKGFTWHSSLKYMIVINRNFSIGPSLQTDSLVGYNLSFMISFQVEI